MIIPQQVIVFGEAVANFFHQDSSPCIGKSPSPLDTVQGFDISHYQTTIDFQAAYDSGARFVILKLRGSTLQHPIPRSSHEGLAS